VSKRLLAGGGHFGVQARNRWTLDDTGFVTVTLTPTLGVRGDSMRRAPLVIGAVLLVLFAKPHPAGMIVGTILIALGEALRIWAAGHLQKNETLTVTGPYGYVKNPLYIGSILITAGFCILGDNIYLLALAMFMFCFHYIPYKKRIEGDRLRKIFGKEFDDYDQKVPEYLPRRTPYSDKKVSWQFKAFIENSEEGILLMNVFGVLLILSRPYWWAIF
jgi:protein-S-isoprenylcysteine O-methyltransferase Ste14